MIAVLTRGGVPARTASAAHRGGTVLMVIGMIGLAGAAWLTIRAQQLGFPSGFGDRGEVPDPSFLDRIDLLAVGIGLMYLGAFAAGAGAGTRLLADYVRSHKWLEGSTPPGGDGDLPSATWTA